MGDHCDHDDDQLNSDRRDCGRCHNYHGESDPDDGDGDHDGDGDQHDHNLDQDYQNQLKNRT